MILMEAGMRSSLSFGVSGIVDSDIEERELSIALPNRVGGAERAIFFLAVRDSSLKGK
jgi:hypothetical protein